MKTAVLLSVVLLSLKMVGQTYIYEIKIGDKMPAKIEKGEYLEGKSLDCNCSKKSKDCNSKTFSIKSAASDIGNVIRDTISMYYDQNNNIYGISKTILFKSKADALKYYWGKVNTIDEMRAYFPDIQLPPSRDIPTMVRNYKYSFNNGKYKKVITLDENKVIEETYISGSNFRNREGFDE